ncbi:hypothetical protein AcW1_007034 [Taiwanofungus camphoratus]|nr:hypothetical protein AcV5_002839 [Antrodia cinnamomea]KAI0925098.1 hypothetical protein AcW2_005787 [Antrodia cinnamomea]KAI0929682.1 hypothetical protein AcV7_005159 [Antrodia cinnamomea]KAI0955451.1 hypothetical protein AcW1_007034 [Antrodia cinnamomea]
MFYRDESNCSVGVLCDWDLAMSKPSLEDYNADDREDESYEYDYDDILNSSSGRDDKGSDSQAPHFVQTDDGNAHNDARNDSTPNKSSKRPRERTGLGPFTALDLLSGPPLLYRYRHDLNCSSMCSHDCAP